MENLEIYNKLKEVPKEAQKKITGGRLSGMTDIKPMWRIEKLTEIFGAVGLGWFTKTLNKQIIDGANNEKIAVVDIELYVNYKQPLGLDEDLWSKGIEGSGGSSFIAKEKAGLYTSDECFKMAYTDALSVACKSLGMGANVYWGDSKYNTTEITKEDAEAYKFGEKAKYPNKTIMEVLEIDSDYLQWWLDNGKNEQVKQMITLLTGMIPTPIPSEEEQLERFNLLNQMKELINKTNTDYEKLLEYFNVKSNSELTDEQLKEAIKIMVKKEKNDKN